VAGSISTSAIVGSASFQAGRNYMFGLNVSFDLSEPLWIDLLGYAAAFMVLTTFCMSTMIRLRWVAIASNVLFILYGYFDHLNPVLILHSILLPVNAIRLAQIYRLTHLVERADGEGLSIKSLLPLMTRRSLPAKTTLITKGDLADKLYYLMEGELEVVEIGKTLGPGSVIGEIGVFAPDRKRTATVVVCATDCVVYELTERKTKELYFQNPAFGYAVMQLIVARLLENQRFAANEEGAVSA
jgi:CRP/FNR family transcriptional regulator, cyclic AMP receptor protein